MKTDKLSHSSGKGKKKSNKSEHFDDVDKRIQIPMATRMKMQMNLKMNSASASACASSSSSEDTRLLRSGIDQYRSLQHLNTSTANPRRARGSAERAAERGVALMERKQFGAAVPYFTEALDAMTASASELGATNMGTVKLYHQRGLCYLAAHKYKPAIEDLSKVMQMTPKSAELYAKRGKAYAALGEHHAAMLDYNEAISLAATQGLLHDRGGMGMESDGLTSTFAGGASLVQLRGLYLARAKVYKSMNNIAHALEDLGHAESSAGGHRDLELFYERAQLYLQCHQDSLALQDFDRYLELQEEAYESRHFDASGGVGGLAGFGAPQEMEAEPKARMLDVLLERAKLLQRMALEEDARERKDVELAAVEQGQGAKKTPKAGKGGSKLAYTSVPPKPEPYRGIESRRLEKRALHDYSRAIELESSNVETFRLRGEAFMHLARYEEALADFASALELDPHDFQVCMARAKLFRQRGDLKGAVQEVTAVLRVNGFFINGLKLRAQLYEDLGAIQDAEKDYSSIIHAHFDKPGIEDAAASGKVSMELASGGTLNLGGHGGKSSNASGKNGKAGSSGKITSEVAAQALLCRARLRLASEQFDAAEEDYSAILKSFANNMEAQLELQETQERRIAFEERKQREAVAWLEQNADEMDGAGVLNVNATSGKSKKKKKKKKKKNSSSSTANANSNGKPQAPAGYVLLVDEEELQQQQQQQGEEQQRIQLQRGQEQKEKQSGLEDEKKDRREEMPASPPDVPEPDQETKDTGAESSVNIEANEQQDTKSAVASPEENVLSDKIDRHEAPPAKADQVDGSSQEIVANHEQSAAPVATPPPSIVVANVMTRDEAWESMWDEEADEPLEAGAVRIRIRAQSTSDMVEDRMTGNEPSREDETSTGEMEKSSMVEDKNHAGNLEDAPTNGDDEANDEASGSSDDGKDSQGKAKAVLVDEKYLKKREKQLKKLRASLQHASDERDKSAIDEALARAERKQMSDALQDDIQRARDVLADMAAETQRLREALPPAGPASNSATGSEHGRMHLHTVTPTNSPSSATPGASKPPSLVIRPIAYGQALQAAEQHQQQLRAHQKLLEEKDAEIAQLKKLLAQKEQAPADPTPQEDARSLDARAHAKAAALSRRVARLRTQFPVQSAAARQADALIEWMGPSDAADRVRQQVLSFVQRVITAHFPLAAAPLFFATGSYPMKTYLPGSDLDICLLVPQELESSWYFIVTQALCIAGGSGGAGTVLDVGNAGGSVDGSGSSSPSGPAVGSGSSGALLLTNTVRNVTFINADVRVVKCTVDNIPVDFTANRVGALGAVRLLDAMAVRVGRQHLFKKSLILIKAWCTHESSPFMQAASVESGGGLGPSVVPGSTPTSVMGASHGALSTYAVNTIVMALFNQHGDALTHPLQALYLFLDRLAEFPWHEAALTLHGAVPLSRLATTPLNGSTPSKSKLKAAKLDAGDVEAIRDTLSDQFGAFDAGLRSGKSAPTSLFPIRACNIVDPLDDKNNLARSVSAEGFPVMKRAFRLARDQLAAMLAPRSSHKDDDAELLSEETGNDVGMAFFSRCWQLYGRGDGWRPDLLIHPRQIWHGKAASTSSSGSAKKGKASPRPRAASSSPVQQNSDEDEDRRWESLLPKLDAGAVNALLLQHQQLQQQAAAAAAYHGAMIAYQQPYYQQQQQQHGPPMGSPGAAGPVVVANGVAAGPGAVVAEQGPYYQPTLRRPYGSPGASQRSKSPPPRNVGPQNGKTPMGGRRFDSSSPQRS